LVPGNSFSNLLPYVDFRLYATELIDTTLVRVDHMWSGPDQGPLAADIVEIGNTHYWNVDGLWPEGTLLQGRLYYYGSNEDQFDYELINGDENGIAVLYRATPMDEWVLCPDQEVNAGNLNNGIGSITVSAMRKGQYTFGKINGFTGIEQVADEPLTIALAPVPTTGPLSINGNLDGQGMLWCDILGIDGRFVRRVSTSVNGAFRLNTDVSDLAAGTYILRVQDARSGVHQERRFEVIH
jgi:hypothetical protein